MPGRNPIHYTLPPAPDLSFETRLWLQGVQAVAGIDEAGRGALAGPVAAAAIILPADPDLSQQLTGVKDSKQMTPLARTRWAIRLKEIALTWGVGFASAEEIDAIGILPATCLAARRAVEQLKPPPEHLLIDYIRLPEISIPQTSLVKGDARCTSIAAASILAKTSRDLTCNELDERYPGYGFRQHKGYGTAAHLAALQRLGPAPVHRRSFAPIARYQDGARREHEQP
jgi:ribonuclease HII